MRKRAYQAWVSRVESSGNDGIVERVVGVVETTSSRWRGEEIRWTSGTSVVTGSGRRWRRLSDDDAFSILSGDAILSFLLRESVVPL